MKQLIRDRPRWLNRLIVLAVPIVTIFWIFRFEIPYPFLVGALLLAQAQIIRSVWPGLLPFIWRNLAQTKIQLIILAVSITLLLFWSTGIFQEIVEARDAPENEFGSWGEWLNLLVGTIVAVVNTIIAWQLYRVTRVLTVNTVVGEFLNKAMELAAPDGKVIDFTPMTCLLVTQKLAVVLNSPEGINSEDLAMIFKRLDGIYGLSVIKYKAAAQQIDVDEAGLPVRVPHLDPRFEEYPTETPRVVRLVRLDLIAYLLAGRSMARQSLSGVDLSWTEWTRFNFSGTDLRGALFHFTVLKGCNFTEANLLGTKFWLSRSYVEKTYHEEIEGKAKIYECNFTDCTIDLLAFNFLFQNSDDVTKTSLASATIIDETGNELIATKVLANLNGKQG
ncbi:pentapeptide repeat-containing protein [Gloeocapsa sp. PCC 73106]|uniref:pentapeptide repeat-containing protein n=1 Tax=Gloeocapsa sp. PCC 73106 TaxID=102232 RepID=UPI0002ABE0CD|nr:pentapeptide repeat-containing protein [Gloeocapsa sp. PCC 73106]ELR97868.1 putative low-complexity protein [Gloeocapsa sp. PCC 73106]